MTDFIFWNRSYTGKLSCVQISLPLLDICFVQEPKAVAALWKSTLFSSPIVIYTVALESRFGIKAQASKAYKADKSGPCRKRHPRSYVAPHNRIGYLTHDSLVRGLMGPGLPPMFHRYQNIFRTQHVQSLREQSHRSQWGLKPDMLLFFRENLGRSIWSRSLDRFYFRSTLALWTCCGSLMNSLHLSQNMYPGGCCPRPTGSVVFCWSRFMSGMYTSGPISGLAD